MSRFENKAQMTIISKMNLLDTDSKIMWAKAGNASNVFCGADDQKRIMLWKIHKSTPKMTLTGSPSDIRCISFDKDDKTLHAGTEGGSIYWWDLTSTKYSAKLSGHLTYWNFIEVASDEEGYYMISGSDDTTVKLWDMRSSKCIQTIKHHTKSVKWAKLSPDGYWVASGGADGNTFITDIRTGKIIYWFEEAGQTITSVEFNPKTYTLTTGWQGKWINYYDLEKFAVINSMKFNTSAVKEIKFYDKEDFDFIEWGFYGSDDYIRLINWEKNSQANIYSVPHDTLWDMKIDFKNELLTWLWSYQSDMAYWGVKLPEISMNDEEVDMEVDGAGTEKYEQAYSMKNAASQGTVTPGFSSKATDYEEAKLNTKPQMKVLSQPKYEDYQSYQVESRAVPPVKGDEYDRTILDESDWLSKTTFQLAPENTPAGIDFDEFSSKSNTQELKDIDKVLEKHFHFMDSLKQRQQKLRNIISLYNPHKNISMTLSALDQMNDLGVTQDVCFALFVEGDFAKRMNMKQWLQVFPYLESLVNSKHESHFITGASSIHNMLKHIGQDIISMRNYPVSKGVDLEREQRLKIWDSLLDMFRTIFKGNIIKKRSKIKNNWGKVAKNLYIELNNFLALSENTKGGGDNQQLEPA